MIQGSTLRSPLGRRKENMMRRVLPLSLAAVAVLCLGADPPKPLSAEKVALAPLQPYVGSWRGAGQIKRGSAQGAWAEEAEWVWHFSDARASLVLKTPKGKYF